MRQDSPPWTRLCADELRLTVSSIPRLFRLRAGPKGKRGWPHFLAPTLGELDANAVSRLRGRVFLALLLSAPTTTASTGKKPSPSAPLALPPPPMVGGKPPAGGDRKEKQQRIPFTHTEKGSARRKTGAAFFDAKTPPAGSRRREMRGMRNAEDQRAKNSLNSS